MYVVYTVGKAFTDENATATGDEAGKQGARCLMVMSRRQCVVENDTSTYITDVKAKKIAKNRS